MGKNFDRIRGALFGLAVGDALGAPLEFMSAEQIQKKYGRVTEMVGGGVWGVEPGGTTDDTAMAIAVGRGILENPEDPVPTVGKHFLEWYKTGPQDIGATTRRVMAAAMRMQNSYRENLITTEEWLDIAKKYGVSDGNGALMRTIYPALLYNDFFSMMQHTQNIALMTHYSPTSQLLCCDYCNLVFDAIRGKAITIPTTEHRPPTGYVVDTFANAMEAIDQTSSFKDAVINAVNRGGDADTIGAVAGGLAGAMYGYSQIPKEWIDALGPLTKAKLDVLAIAAYNYENI